VGEHPYCVTVSTDGSRIYVTNTQSDNVSVIDVAQQKVISIVPVGGYPEGISFDHANQRVYVANWFDNTVSVIDASNNKLVNTIATDKQSRAFGQFIQETAH
jgi:YVTN family beta-propeller protein